jgi:hypothetical protein
LSRSSSTNRRLPATPMTTVNKGSECESATKTYLTPNDTSTVDGKRRMFSHKLNGQVNFRTKMNKKRKNNFHILVNIIN